MRGEERRKKEKEKMEQETGGVRGEIGQDRLKPTENESTSKLGIGREGKQKTNKNQKSILDYSNVPVLGPGSTPRRPEPSPALGLVPDKEETPVTVTSPGAWSLRRTDPTSDGASGAMGGEKR